MYKGCTLKKNRHITQDVIGKSFNYRLFRWVAMLGSVTGAGEYSACEAAGHTFGATVSEREINGRIK